MTNPDESKALVPVSHDESTPASRAFRLLALAGMASSQITRPQIYMGFDATASRTKTWAAAIRMQGDTLKFLTDAGEVAPNLRVSCFKGKRKFQTVGWTTQTQHVQDWMSGISLETGSSQISRVLTDALEQIDLGIPIASLMYVGDLCEDDGKKLAEQAKKIGLAGTPITIQQEVRNQEKLNSFERSAQQVFQRLADASGGDYVSFDHQGHQDMMEVNQVVVARAYGPRSRATRKLLANPEKMGLIARTLLLTGPK